MPAIAAPGQRFDRQRQRLADLHPRRHLLGDFGGELQRIDFDQRHHRRLGLDELAERDEPLLHVGVERRADRGVAQRGFGQLQVRLLGVDVGAQIARALHRRFVARLLRLQRRVRIVELLLRDERALLQLRGAAERLLRLRELGRGLLHVRRALDGRQRRREIRHAVARHGPAQRRALLIEPILELLGIEDDERLAGGDAIAEVGGNAEHAAFDLGGDRHFFVGRERADDVDGAADVVGFDLRDRDGLRRCDSGPRTVR